MQIYAVIHHYSSEEIGSHEHILNLYQAEFTAEEVCYKLTQFVDSVWERFESDRAVDFRERNQEMINIWRLPENSEFFYGDSSFSVRKMEVF